ncbi:hypothetical protein EYC84_011500 [Monilinia fructicola]|uniref:Uncharacterized protein n=1 Tax=Monilinia fructicola TaxID=38448 RepID=A0A5M9JBB6_MONFR|nr:hypothetical protein EYC84_011500 [Monilinia fructicola]
MRGIVLSYDLELITPAPQLVILSRHAMPLLELPSTGPAIMVISRTSTSVGLVVYREAHPSTRGPRAFREYGNANFLPFSYLQKSEANGERTAACPPNARLGNKHAFTTLSLESLHLKLQPSTHPRHRLLSQTPNTSPAALQFKIP